MDENDDQSGTPPVFALPDGKTWFASQPLPDDKHERFAQAWSVPGRSKRVATDTAQVSWTSVMKWTSGKNQTSQMILARKEWLTERAGEEHPTIDRLVAEIWRNGKAAADEGKRKEANEAYRFLIERCGNFLDPAPKSKGGRPRKNPPPRPSKKTLAALDAALSGLGPEISQDYASNPPKSPPEADLEDENEDLELLADLGEAS